MMLLYDSANNNRETLEKAGKLPVPARYRIVMLTSIEGFPEKAAGTDYENAVFREMARTEYLPGLDIKSLFLPETYMFLPPCRSVILYYDGMDVRAETGHEYGRAHTVIRCLSRSKYEKAWDAIGKTDRKSWYKLLKLTVPVQEAVPEIMSLARPCRLVTC